MGYENGEVVPAVVIEYPVTLTQANAIFMKHKRHHGILKRA